MRTYWAIVLSAATMLSAVGLVSTGAWLISSAALMPPIMVLQVAIVSVRFFGISRGIFRWSERVVSHDVALSGTTELRVALWRVAARLGPLGVWRLRSSDALDRLTSDTDQLQDEMTRVRVPMYAAGLSAALLCVLQFLLVPLAGLVFALAFLVSGYIIPKTIIRIELKIARDAIEVRNLISSDIYRAITNNQKMRMLDTTDLHMTQLDSKDQLRIKIESRYSIWTGISGAINGVSAGATVFISLVAGIVAFAQGGLSGQMIAVVTLLPWASSEIIGTFSLAASAKARTTLAKERISEFVHRENRVPISEKTTLIRPSILSLKEVAVGWNDEMVVKDLEFNLRRGEILGLTGPSGSGKSTIANAILRLIPHQGKIEIDGCSIYEIANYEKHLTALLQTTYIFHTTLRENLRLANHESTDQQLIETLTMVGLDKWFSELTDGLDTFLGDSVRGLSGGEIQRVGIARTILTGASFVVLDEPTEHLDSETAMSIWQLIERVFVDQGVLVITHDQRIVQKLKLNVSLV